MSNTEIELNPDSGFISATSQSSTFNFEESETCAYGSYSTPSSYSTLSNSLPSLKCEWNPKDSMLHLRRNRSYSWPDRTRQQRTMTSQSTQTEAEDMAAEGGNLGQVAQNLQQRHQAGLGSLIGRFHGCTNCTARAQTVYEAELAQSAEFVAGQLALMADEYETAQRGGFVGVRFRWREIRLAAGMFLVAEVPQWFQDGLAAFGGLFR